MSWVRFLYVPRMRPVAYVISGADLEGSLAEELICAWFLAKTKKENGKIRLTTLCDIFMTETFLKSKETSQAK